MKFSLPSTISGLCLFAAAGAMAHESATGMIKQRMDFMKGVATTTKSLAGFVSGTQPYDAGQVQVLANELAAFGGKTLTDQFPDGSLEAPTEASPEIWSDWQRFSQLAEELTGAAQAIALAAEIQDSPDQLKPLFVRVGETCKSCHQEFRIDQDG